MANEDVKETNAGDFALDMGDYGIPAQELRCPRCLPPETMISGYSYNQIGCVEIGDVVYGYTNHHNKNTVKEIFQHYYDGDLIILKAQGCLPIELTPEHELAIVTGTKRNWGKHRITITDGPRWVKACDVVRRPNPYAADATGHYLLIPAAKGYYSNKIVSLHPFLNKLGQRALMSKGFPCVFPLNQDTAWLLGLYVADGYSDDEVAFYLGSNEKLTQERLCSVISHLGYTPRLKAVPDEKATGVFLQSRVLARLFRYYCGSNAHKKIIPKFIIEHYDDRILLAFLQGYLAGDGYLGRKIEEESWRINASTSSKRLALQLQLLGARLGQLFSIRQVKIGDSRVKGRVIKSNGPHYCIDIFPGEVTKSLGFDKNSGFNKYKRLKDYIAVPVTSIRQEHYTGSVMNLETNNSTYLAHNLIVHNCHRFLGYVAIAWGAVRIKCPNCKTWTTLDIAPKKS